MGSFAEKAAGELDILLNIAVCKDRHPTGYVAQNGDRDKVIVRVSHLSCDELSSSEALDISVSFHIT